MIRAAIVAVLATTPTIVMTHQPQSPSSLPDAIRSAEASHKTWFVVSGVFGVVVALGSWLIAYMVWISGNRVNTAVQADANVRIKEAEAVGKSADARAADANRAAEQLRLDLVEANRNLEQLRMEVAVATERAATAISTAATAINTAATADTRALAADAKTLAETLARLKNQAPTQRRVLFPDRLRAMSDALSRFAPMSAVIVPMSADKEVAQLVQTLDDTLRHHARWTVGTGTRGAGGGLRGITIAMAGNPSDTMVEAAQSLMAQLHTFDIYAVVTRTPINRFVGFNVNLPPDHKNPEILIMIGDR